MANNFDSFGNYNGNFKQHDHVGNIVPAVEYSEGNRPHGEWQTAEWLPITFFDKYYEDWAVATPGKIIACDNDGKLVPAQYGLAGANVTYAAIDAADFVPGPGQVPGAGVLDVRTGAPLLLADVTTFAVSGVSSFMGSGVAMSVGRPQGIAAYVFLQAAGGDGVNPANFRQHNYNRQAKVGIITDYAIELPLVPQTTATETLTWVGEVANVSTSDPLADLPVATNTQRTPITFATGAAATLFVNQKDTVAQVLAAGDWHISLTDGVISVWTAGGGVPAGGETVTYSNYAGAPASVSAFASCVGNPSCGDYLVCDANSNFAVLPELAAGDVGTAGDIATAVNDLRGVMGQVLEVAQFPLSGLGRVKTPNGPLNNNSFGALPGSLGQMDQMPGSATGGVSAKVHYAGAADLVVRINLTTR